MKRLEDIQDALYQAAKTDKKRKFDTMHDKICRNDVITEAWRRVKANHGTAGIDRVTLESITDEESFIRELRKDLENRSYRVDSVKRVYIPKKDHSLRPLGIPTVRDRVVQQAVKLII
jgi:retron-type reverse transcriptase